MADETPLTDDEKLERELAGERAFLDKPEAQISGGVREPYVQAHTVTLRPITLASLSMLRRTGNEFLVPQGPEVEVVDPQTKKAVMIRQPRDFMFAAMAFAYIHGAPIEEVRTAVWTPSYFRNEVDKFGDRLEPAALDLLLPIIEGRLARIAKLDFATKKKPSADGEASGPDAPPNS